MLEDLLEVMVDAETSAGFLIILAFIVGALVQRISSPSANGSLDRMLRLLEAVASYLGAEHHGGDRTKGDHNG